MLLAVLELSDYAILIILIAFLMSAQSSTGRAATRERLRRLEDKLNLILDEMGIDYVPENKERWQRLAESGNTDDAISEYVQAHSVSSDDATQVVEQYLSDRKRTR